MSDERLEFIDPHMHMWELARGWYPLLEGVPPEQFNLGPLDLGPLIGKDFTLDDYLEVSRSVHVTKVVHIVAARTPPSWPDETRVLQELFEKRGFPQGIIAMSDFHQPIRAVDAELGEHELASPNFRGVRHLMSDGIDYADQHVEGCMKVMEGRGLIYDTVAQEWNLPAAARLTRKCEGMTFVLEHTGWPTAATPEVFATWKAGIEEFAKSPNTAIKISGLGMTLGPNWTVEDIRPWVETAIEVFGPERCMFATNFPIDSLTSAYDFLIEAFREITAGASEADRRAMYHDNAERWYRI